MSTDPTAEHVDAMACALLKARGYGPLRLPQDASLVMDAHEDALGLLRSTDPAVHAALAASLPAEVMLATLRSQGLEVMRVRDHKREIRMADGEVAP